MENKHWAILIIIFALVFVGVLYLYDQTVSNLAANACTETAATCPHEKVVETQRIVIAALLLLIVALVVALIKKGEKPQHPVGKPLKEEETGRDEAQARQKPSPPEPAAQGEVVEQPAKKAAMEQAEPDVSKLEQDEKQVYLIIKEKGGSVFQSDLIRETGFTKVKVSRLLDRLEHKGLLERKRRGMANIIVLK